MSHPSPLKRVPTRSDEPDQTMPTMNGLDQMGLWLLCWAPPLAGPDFELSPHGNPGAHLA